MASHSGLFGLAPDDFRKIPVWLKGHEISGWEGSVWRMDDFGGWMKFSDYGDRSSTYGWEIDHIVPVALGGSDDISNLRPLHFRVNASLGGILATYLKG